MNEEKDYEKIGRLIYGLQRAGLGQDALKAIAADATRPERAARAARLEQEYARILACQGEGVADDDIAAALEEGVQLVRGDGAA